MLDDIYKTTQKEDRIMKNTVYCMGIKRFAVVCREFTALGLTFEADAVRLTITLTGGF